ncbi:hypothetical protein AXK11_05595 [Cephaloticoccus primus]|uniref:3-deoxy-D-manno-octulosonic acid transferase n=1 Tax=Cephaloticoccus primus TaxID=1548207 RepID=A0A139SMP9_9BACT|nr:glycosyltransferase N-terminal domain-containing protein [Cephaloticoccus primus]KXU35815.1 hypothetical protein AXK11_05595 [Cephaloticoccus primus]
MLWLYRLLYPFALLIGAPFYLRRMWRRGGYREGFAQRFGRVPALPPLRPKHVSPANGTAAAARQRIWLQAVSVGELLAVAPLLEAWARAGHEVYLTTTTSTGYRLARERYTALTIGIGYLPLDWWLFSARAWRAVNPDLALLMEGERWPEHIAQAARRGVPVACLNARLSDRSFRRMRRARWAVKPLLGGITQILACSPEDAQRFRALGFAAGKIETTGNIKLDVRVPPLGADARAQLRRELGIGAVAGEDATCAPLVLLGASTWPGEEAALVDAFLRVRAASASAAAAANRGAPPISLVLVPRHAERRGEIAALLRERGLSHRLRSDYLRSADGFAGVPPNAAATAAVEVAVADTTGELQQLLQVADLVFVGKSLPPHTEGQTPVESAILGKPILFGPGMGNFRAIARELVNCGAARVVPDPQALAAQVCALLTAEAGASARAAMGAAGRAWHAQNVGAVERTVRAVAQLVEPGRGHK